MAFELYDNAEKGLKKLEQFEKVVVELRCYKDGKIQCIQATMKTRDYDKCEYLEDTLNELLTAVNEHVD